MQKKNKQSKSQKDVKKPSKMDLDVILKQLSKGMMNNKEHSRNQGKR